MWPFHLSLITYTLPAQQRLFFYSIHQFSYGFFQYVTVSNFIAQLYFLQPRSLRISRQWLHLMGSSCCYSELQTELPGERNTDWQAGRVTDRQMVETAVWVSVQIPHRLSGSLQTEWSQRSSSSCLFCVQSPLSFLK